MIFKVGDKFKVIKSGITFKLTKWWGIATPPMFRVDLSGYWSVYIPATHEHTVVTTREIREMLHDGKWALA